MIYRFMISEIESYYFWFLNGSFSIIPYLHGKTGLIPETFRKQ